MRETYKNFDGKSLEGAMDLGGGCQNSTMCKMLLPLKVCRKWLINPKVAIWKDNELMVVNIKKSMFPREQPAVETIPL